MEDPVFTDISENANSTTVSEVSDSEENKGGDLFDHVHEDSASPFSITNTPENMDGSKENSEDSCNDSVASQHGSDGEDDSSSHHGAEEDYPQQQMDLMSPILEDKDEEDSIFESNLHFPPDFQFRQRQSTFTNSSTSLKFPLNNNSGETNNFQEDFEISVFVKVRTWVLLSIPYFKTTNQYVYPPNQWNTATHCFALNSAAGSQSLHLTPASVSRERGDLCCVEVPGISSFKWQYGASILIVAAINLFWEISLLLQLGRYYLVELVQLSLHFTIE